MNLLIYSMYDITSPGHNELKDLHNAQSTFTSGHEAQIQSQ